MARPTGKVEVDAVASLEREHLARLRRLGDLETEALDDLARQRHLLGVGFCQPAGAGPERILEADAHIAAHRSGHGGDGKLVAPGAQHRPVILVAEKAVGGAFHMDDVLGMRADAAEDAEHALHEERRLDQAAIDEIGAGVEMADVVALDLETRAVVGAGQAVSSLCRKRCS